METIFRGINTAKKQPTASSNTTSASNLSNQKTENQDDFLIIVKHFNGDVRYISVPHFSASTFSVSDSKLLYLDTMSKLPSKEQHHLAGDILAANGASSSRRLFAAASLFGGSGNNAQSNNTQSNSNSNANFLGGGGGGNSSTSSNVSMNTFLSLANSSSSTTSGGGLNTTASAGTSTSSTTSTRFSGMLAKNFTFKNVTVNDITFATRDGHVLQDIEKISYLRRPCGGGGNNSQTTKECIELFVIPNAPHKAQEPLLTVSTLFPFSKEMQQQHQQEQNSHIVIRDYDFSFLLLSHHHSLNSGGNSNISNTTTAIKNSEDLTHQSPEQTRSPTNNNSNATLPPLSPNSMSPSSTSTSTATMKRQLKIRQVPISSSNTSSSSPSTSFLENSNNNDDENDENDSSPNTKNNNNNNSSTTTTCGDFIVHVHPTQTTIIDGTLNSVPFSSSGINSQIITTTSSITTPQTNNNNNNISDLLSPLSSSSSPPPPETPSTLANLNATPQLSEQKHKTSTKSVGEKQKQTVFLSCFEQYGKFSSFYGRNNNSNSQNSSAQQRYVDPTTNITSTSNNENKLLLFPPPSTTQNTGTTTTPTTTTNHHARFTDRKIHYFSSKHWSPVYSWVSPEGNFVIVQLICNHQQQHQNQNNQTTNSSSSQRRRTDSMKANNKQFASSTTSSLSQLLDSPTGMNSFAIPTTSATATSQNIVVPNAFLIYESVSRGSAWICRGSFRLPATSEISLSGWCSANRFVLCAGNNIHVVVKVEVEGQINIHCCSLDFVEEEDENEKEDEKEEEQQKEEDDKSPPPSASPRSCHNHHHTSLQILRVLPNYPDGTMIWFDRCSSILRIFTENTITNSTTTSQQQQSSCSSSNNNNNANSSSNSAFALHLKRSRGHHSPFRFSYCLQSRQPKWELNSSCLPQFALSPGSSGYFSQGFCLEDTRANNNNTTNTNAETSSSSSNSNNNKQQQQNSKSSSSGEKEPLLRNSENFDDENIRNSVNVANQALTSFSSSPPDDRPMPQAIYFMHNLDVLVTAPDPPDEALLLMFPDSLVYVSEHKQESLVFKKDIVSPPIYPGCIIAAQYAKPQTSSTNSSSSSSSNSSGQFARLRIVYASDDAEGTTTIHIVTLQSEWKSQNSSAGGASGAGKDSSSSGGGLFDYFKKKISFLRSGGSDDDDAAAIASRKAMKLAESSHKQLKVTGIEAFMHGACDCYMASAAPVGVMIKATMSGGVAVLRLRKNLV